VRSDRHHHFRAQQSLLAKPFIEYLRDLFLRRPIRKVASDNQLQTPQYAVEPVRLRGIDSKLPNLAAERAGYGARSETANRSVDPLPDVKRSGCLGCGPAEGDVPR
jgi:hypothetical protein